MGDIFTGYVHAPNRKMAELAGIQRLCPESRIADDTTVEVIQCLEDWTEDDCYGGC